MKCYTASYSPGVFEYTTKAKKYGHWDVVLGVLEVCVGHVP